MKCPLVVLLLSLRHMIVRIKRRGFDWTPFTSSWNKSLSRHFCALHINTAQIVTAFTSSSGDVRLVYLQGFIPLVWFTLLARGKLLS